MSDFDDAMKSALDSGGGFDPDRARSAQDEVFREYQRKLKTTQRTMAVLLCVLVAAAVYAIQGYTFFAVSVRECVAYSMVVLLTIVIVIQKTILYGITASQLVTMKEIKQMRLVIAGGMPQEQLDSSKPLRGLGGWERAVWVLVIWGVLIIASNLGSRANRQDDLWRIGAGRQVEVHSVLTLRRFPHELQTIRNVRPPINTATLKSATLNGRPVPVMRSSYDEKTYTTLYRIDLPRKLRWGADQVELVWEPYTLPQIDDYRQYTVQLRSMVPVHRYSLTAYIQDDSGLTPAGDAWKFNKSADDLKNEAEARRTIKCFTGRNQLPESDFGSRSLGIVAKH